MTDNTSMLERMARAMSEEGVRRQGDDPTGLWDTWMTADMKEDMRALARAALQAIREPSPDVARAGMDGIRLRSPTATFGMMVDAILSEGPTNG